MLTQINPVMDIQRFVAEILRNEPWFAAHNVKIIEQNSQELQFLLRTKLDEMKGVSLVVGTDGMSNDHPAMEMRMTIACTERVTINRAKQGFATAIDAVQAAIQLLDGAKYGDIEQAIMWKDMAHESNREVDLLRATATFRVLVNRNFIDKMVNKTL